MRIIDMTKISGTYKMYVRFDDIMIDSFYGIERSRFRQLSEHKIKY